MKWLKVAGRYINPMKIDAIRLDPGYPPAVWVTGKDEPLHATTDEACAIQEYVREAMGHA